MLTAICNGRIVTENIILDGKVLLIEDERILDIVDENKYDGGAWEVDAEGNYVIPGLIDTHSDMIELLIQPRPNTTIDFEIALKEAEKQLINQGITTMYHSISLYTDTTFGPNKMRTLPNVKKLLDLIASLNLRAHLIHHCVHLRYEIENVEALEFVREMVESKKIHEISFMDHTPGQGQYKDMNIYRETVMAYNKGNMDDQKFSKILEHHTQKQVVTVEDLKEIAKLAKQNNIPVASHDDDCLEKLVMNETLGVEISEFPITIEVAKEAEKRGFLTSVGAPNVLRGVSHSGNLSAQEAILNHSADILCSDYYPPAMLHAVFKMHDEFGVDLCEMVRLVTSNPAKAMKIDDDYGSIAPGKKADIVFVEVLDGYPVVTNVFVHGRSAAKLAYGR
jgi:alpha-D-ribose 1-methylphosphonate 5-triphosphate diphosphatase